MALWESVLRAATPQAPLSLAWAAIPSGVVGLVVSALHTGDGASLRTEVRSLLFHVTRSWAVPFLT